MYAVAADTVHVNTQALELSFHSTYVFCIRLSRIRQYSVQGSVIREGILNYIEKNFLRTICSGRKTNWMVTSCVEIPSKTRYRRKCRETDRSEVKARDKR